MSLLNRKQVAERLGYSSTKSIRRLVKLGQLKEIRISDHARRYDPREVEALITNLKGGESESQTIPQRFKSGESMQGIADELGVGVLEVEAAIREAMMPKRISG